MRKEFSHNGACCSRCFLQTTYACDKKKFSLYEQQPQVEKGLTASVSLGMGMGLGSGLGVHRVASGLVCAFLPPATVPALGWDVGMAAACVVLSTAWVQLWSVLVSRGSLQSTVSRKIVHCGSGPLFLLLWPFFSPSGR
jgi:hypothetical protein